LFMSTVQVRLSVQDGAPSIAERMRGYCAMATVLNITIVFLTSWTLFHIANAYVFLSSSFLFGLVCRYSWLAHDCSTMPRGFWSPSTSLQ